MSTNFKKIAAKAQSNQNEEDALKFYVFAF